MKLTSKEYQQSVYDKVKKESAGQLVLLAVAITTSLIVVAMLSWLNTL